MAIDGSYSVKIHKKFSKVVSKNLPPDLKRVLDKKIDYFSKNPNHPSLNTKSLTISDKNKKRLGVDEVVEFYINRKDYRCVVYVLHESKEFWLVFVGNHSQVKNFCK
jgi:mRNA-degrading endonuclease RelE of RelBE toxin-antitoxin system